MGFGVWGLGFEVKGLGFGVWSLGFRVWGLGFRIWDLGLGFEVWGLGLRVNVLGVEILGSKKRGSGSGFRVWGRAVSPEEKHLPIWPLRVGKEWEVGVENVVLAVELQPHLERPGPGCRALTSGIGRQNKNKNREVKLYQYKKSGRCVFRTPFLHS